MSEEWKPTKKEMEQYLTALVNELNVRLLSGEMGQKGAEDADGTFPGWEEQVMWVESITLTGYERPPEKKRRTIKK